MSGMSCIKAYYNKAEYYMKPHTFYREIVAPLVQWIVYALQMTAVCPNINKVSYEFQTRRASEVIEFINEVTMEKADTQCVGSIWGPTPSSVLFLQKKPLITLSYKRICLKRHSHVDITNAKDVVIQLFLTTWCTLERGLVS